MPPSLPSLASSSLNITFQWTAPANPRPSQTIQLSPLLLLATALFSCTTPKSSPWTNLCSCSCAIPWPESSMSSLHQKALVFPIPSSLSSIPPHPPPPSRSSDLGRSQEFSRCTSTLRKLGHGSYLNVRCIKDKKGSAAFWKGCLVWLGWNLNSFQSSWDGEGEPLKLLSRPKKRCMHFGESGGRLYFISKPRKGVALAVLMMESESSGWSLLCNVNLHPIKNMYPEIRIHYRDMREKSTMFIVRGESKGDNQLMLSIRGLAISFHLQKKTFTRVRGGLPTGCIRMFPQKLTLYSVLF